MKDEIARVLSDYPKIYFACHTRHVRDPKTDAKLSAHQASILDHLDEVEATRITDLAAHIAVTPATMSIHVSRLEARGYLTRTRDANDARSVRLRLSPAGRRIRSANSVLDPERVNDMLSCLGSADRRRALAGLRLLANAAGEAMRRRAPNPRRDLAAGKERAS
jgi:MarR family transcriptional regulator, organic hydroperoxide resistance regulator